MLKSVLKIEGVTVLKRKDKFAVKAGSCADDAWEYGSRMERILGADDYDATEWFYSNFCE
ncbi:hypothetical protein J8281_11105 [Aquimarina sp. U1-2]|uniref:hypothetical protein n=1 Tax=Aquimarina sp. U1-2 TaxID=2823141 RepID=UPI001AEC9FBF|nr:hypothetical protein [Aquimarina sp. U1-2]MBP2832734.1 hypothetical protein [Aquimarina sp. U1-2]